ncbi:MAG: hypothetical protein Q4G49_06705, partial [Paracoccus sp. (in: a-proteobacteria)]|nr:hypothetical protein [Paracoccus sp. (in: a-proteobacteria)]
MSAAIRHSRADAGLYDPIHERIHLAGPKLIRRTVVVLASPGAALHKRPNVRHIIHRRPHADQRTKA